MSRLRPGPEQLLLVTVVLWGVNFSVLKVALETFDPFVLNAVRLSLAGAVLWPLYLRRGQSLAPLRAAPVTILGLGVLGFVCFPVAFLLGVAQTTGGTAALIMASAPLWTALSGRLLGIERIPVRAWIGLGVAVAGTALVVATGTAVVDLSGATLAGNGLVTLAAALWGVYTTLSGRALERARPLALGTFGVTVAVPALWLLAVPGLEGVAWGSVDATAWGAVVYAGVFGVGVGFVWWTAGVEAIGPSRTAVYNNGVPLVALIAGALTLGESIGPVQVTGATLILVGVTVVRRAVPSPPAGRVR